MSWFQQNMGLIVIAAFVLLGAVGVIARMRIRTFQDKLIAKGRTETLDTGVDGAAIATETKLSAVLSLSAPLDTVLAALASHKSSGGWKLAEPGVWRLSVGGKVAGKAATVAALQSSGPDTTQLVLLRSADVFGVPSVGKSWQELCAQLSAVVSAHGIHAGQLEGPDLVRTPVGSLEGKTGLELSMHPHVWLRPGHQL